MPGAFAILFILTILAVLATWMIPAGSYSKLSYDDHVLKVESPQGKVETHKATQHELDKMGVKIDIDQFTSGAINKPVSIPNTYERLDQHPAHLSDITSSMVNGTIEAADIMVFILVLGGLIGVVQASGALESGLLALTKRPKAENFY